MKTFTIELPDEIVVALRAGPSATVDVTKLTTKTVECAAQYGLRKKVLDAAAGKESPAATSAMRKVAETLVTEGWSQIPGRPMDYESRAMHNSVVSLARQLKVKLASPGVKKLDDLLSAVRASLQRPLTDEEANKLTTAVSAAYTVELDRIKAEAAKPRIDLEAFLGDAG